MDFRNFFSSLHGYEPFPWQEEAADRLVAGEALDAVSVPTGCGKTALIDAALFHAAHGGPRRIFFIIDRRVVVDEAYERARRIQERLASMPELTGIAERLGRIEVVRLRGGVHNDDEWVFYPERVTVVLSTVDQVGSRLLHRGYGVSPRMWPVHAGFVGNNAVYLVDEAHLSKPFAATVEAAVKSGAGVRLIQLSATLAGGEGQMLGLTDRDLQHSALAPRLRARKRARLEVVPDPDAQFAPCVADRAEALAGPGDVVGIVVNRVRSARQVWDVLSRTRKRNAKLLIGPIRPHDRDMLMVELMPHIRAGRERGDGEPLFIVATQTIEVGADLDFDALVTEAAPLSALRQRFGRLDRLGRLGDSRACILGREKQIDLAMAEKAPVYGADLYRTWKWLHEGLNVEGEVDFGILSFKQLAAKHLPPMESAVHCPLLLPAHLDLFAQTGPDAPWVDPAPWLHGPQRSSNEVSVVWRADLDNVEAGEEWKELLALCPPMNREAVQLPLPVVRDLLTGKGNSEVCDLEGLGTQSGPHRGGVMPYLRWRGSDDCVLPDGFDLHPGDTVILPTSYGGYDQFGWNPKHDESVTDIAEECAYESGRPFVLRLTQGPLEGWLKDREARSRLISCVADLHAADNALADGDESAEESHDEAWGRLRTTLSGIDHRYVERMGRCYDYTLVSGGVVLTQSRLEEVEGSLNGGERVELQTHVEGVAEVACKVSGNEVARGTVVSAALLHDRGKAAPVFQALLYGDRIRAAAGPLLAKSGMRTRRAFKAALVRSGFPSGFRHELHSLDFIEEDDPLLRHLVATHHGYGRPWFPACEDPVAPGAERAALTGRWASAFAQMQGVYGPWRLAELELLLRAADMRRSQQEREGHHD